MDYCSTSNRPEAEEAGLSPSPHPSADDRIWSSVADAARGTRRLRADGDGRIAELVDATGGRIAFSHDGDGSLRRIAQGDWFMAINAEKRRDGFSVTDPAGRTRMRFAKGGRIRTIVRDRDRLSIAMDGQERVVRVRLPGSAAALLYDWTEDGGCTVRAEGGEALLTLSAVDGARRIALDDVSWIDERARPTRADLSVTLDGVVADTLAFTLDGQFAITGRRWADGVSDRFERDDRRRLTVWTATDAQCNAVEQHWSFDGDHLTADALGLRTVDAGGRTLSSADGAIRYAYDASGRRIMRNDPAGETRYGYDPLGNLATVEQRGHIVTFHKDGLGRRTSVSVDGHVLRHEHRDEIGRLWAVTDADGRPLHVYIWLGDRIAARIDGRVGDPLAEAYLCDPFGTPHGAIVAEGVAWRFERIVAAPYGDASSAARPTLFGHFADPETGLIHMGARDFDPALGLFLTPDPWHGGEDDPRRWAGATPAMLAAERERPQAGFHDYALCRFDPLGRSDRDGHLSAGDVFLHIIRWVLLPTWGFPLTSISLFFFQPLNLYMEVVALIVWGFKAIFCEDKSHPWGYHTIVKATGLLGSVRQFTFAFGLNGFLPRVISGGGVGGDRAVTVGNVIWINREELAFMARPEAVLVDDMAGGVAGTKFNDVPTTRSVVALLGKEDGEEMLHFSSWSRGLGNAVQLAGTTQRFVDVTPAGGGPSRSAIHLRQPIPSSVPVPDEEDDDAVLEVSEYVRVSGDPEAILEVAGASLWSALKLPKDTSFVVGDWLRISAPDSPDPKPDPAFIDIRVLLPADDHVAVILEEELPARFQTANLSSKLQLDGARAVAGAGASGDWAIGAAPATLERSIAPGAVPADFPPALAKGQMIRVDAATPAPAAPAVGGLPAGGPRGTRFAVAKEIRATLTLSPDAGGIAIGAEVRLRVPKGSLFRGAVTKKAEPDKIKLDTPHPDIAAGDLLIVGKGADRLCVRAAGPLADHVLTVVPPLTATLVGADGARVEIQATADTESDEDKASATSVSATDATVSLPRAGLFAPGNLVRFEVGGQPVLRIVDAVAKMAIDLSDPPLGTGPFTLKAAETIADRSRKDVALAPPGRFLKYISGTALGSFGAWPGHIAGFAPAGLIPSVEEETSAYHVQWNGPRPAGIKEEFHRVWSTVTEGADQFVVLETPLPLVVKDGTVRWRVDGEDEGGERDVNLGAPPAPQRFKMQQLAASNAVRKDVAANPRRILAREPEALVPDDPTIHDTHRRTLIEHEIHHTVQCNLWGPLMNALPLPGLIMEVVDIVAAAGGDIPEWLKQVERDANGNPPNTADGRIDNNTELNPFQILSIGGLMQLVWKYILLSPFRASPELAAGIDDLDFEDFNAVFNPLSRLITQNLPQVDPDADAGDRWLQLLGQTLSKALDLRSWTPMLGFIPTLLPDGPQNFIEQGASRASGDLYSTILSANDRYNLTARGRLFGKSDDRSADLSTGLGRPVRLLMFCGYRTDRVFRGAGSDAPGDTVAFRKGLRRKEPFSLVLPEAGKTMLFPADLYSVTRSGGTPVRTLKLQGPAPLRRELEFVEAETGDVVAPRLRAYVPLPSCVNRSLGFYLVAGSPGKLEAGAAPADHTDAIFTVKTATPGATVTIAVSGPELAGSPITLPVITVGPTDTDADVAKAIETHIRADPALQAFGVLPGVKEAKVEVDAPLVARTALSWTVTTTGGITVDAETGLVAHDDPHTDRVTITVGDEVRIDGDLLPWSAPGEVVPPPAPPPPTSIDRFQTESCTIKVAHPKDLKGPGFDPVGILNLVLDLSDPAIVPAPLEKHDGWSFRLPDAPPAAPLRLRIFRTIAKDDPAFDLAFPDEPMLAGRRSYLDDDIFVVVRDAQITVKTLPDLPDAESAFDAPFELVLPIRLEHGDRAIVIVPPAGVAAPPVERIGDDGRGEKWKIGPLATAPGEDAVFAVTVSYGKIGATIDKSFKLTLKAAINLTGGGTEIVPGTPVELDVARGTGPYAVALEPAVDGLAVTQPSPGKILLLANAAPEAETEVLLTVSDTTGLKGARHFTVRTMPPLLLPNDSADYTDYVRPATHGLVTPLINGRSSGGAGPDVDLTEPLNEMEAAVKACAAGDAVYLAAWFFEPATALTGGGLAGITTWGELFRKKAEDGVIVRLLINDFDPISGIDVSLETKDLTPLNALIDGMAAGVRDNLKYQVAMHQATIGSLKAALAGVGFRDIKVASHHQKFMVVRRGDSLTAFCGGIDIESRKTPAAWSYGGLIAWHDLHVKLEGPITRDLEREFVMRWNSERSGTGRPPRPGWVAMEERTPTPLSPADDTPARKAHLVQMLRTVAIDGLTTPWNTKRSDIKQVYRKAITGARRFIYMENQYFRDPALADWIVAVGTAHPTLRVIMVVVDNAGEDDGDNALTSHGDFLQFTTFDRIAKGLGGRASFYTMRNRAVHSKFLLVDDSWMTIGSANANVRSFELDTELNVQIADAPLTLAFRKRLWAHNLGVTEAVVTGWTEADFIAQWNAVAAANLGVANDAMNGEGVVPYDYTARPGKESGVIPDGLTQLDLDGGEENVIA